LSRLEQNELLLEQSSDEVIIVSIWKEAVAAHALKKLVDASSQETVHSIYSTFLEFERRNAIGKSQVLDSTAKKKT